MTFSKVATVIILGLFLIWKREDWFNLGIKGVLMGVGIWGVVEWANQ